MPALGRFGRLPAPRWRTQGLGHSALARARQPDRPQGAQPEAPPLALRRIQAQMATDDVFFAFLVTEL